MLSISKICPQIPVLIVNSNFKKPNTTGLDLSNSIHMLYCLFQHNLDFKHLTLFNLVAVLYKWLYFTIYQISFIELFKQTSTI